VGTPSEVANLKLKDIELQFTRRNYEAIQSKSQVLVSMLQQPKIHPRLAFAHCGMFADPEAAYAISMEYNEEQSKKAMEMMQPPEDNTEEKTEDKEVVEQ
jgi:stringent starvation protein B